LEAKLSGRLHSNSASHPSATSVSWKLSCQCCQTFFSTSGQSCCCRKTTHHLILVAR